MGEVVWYVLGSLCGLLAVVQFVGGLFTIVELRRKWWTVPALCGLDWLDIVYRIEKEFGVTLAAADFGRVSADLTAGQLWEVVRAKIHPGYSPADGWARLVGHLVGALNVKAGR